MFNPSKAPVAVIYVPGIMSSTLFEDAAKTKLYWLDKVEVFTKGLPAMALAADGVSPAPSALQLYPGSAFYFATKYQQAIQEIVGFSGSVLSYPYDWRKSTVANSDGLYAVAKPFLDAGNYVIFACHSMGGLVGVLAASKAFIAGYPLAQLGVVTAGTPFYGSYGTPIQFDPAGIQSNIADLLINDLFNVGLLYQYYLAQYQSTIATFPGLCELSPVALAPAINSDPYIATFYVGTWQAVYKSTPLTSLLNYVATSYQPLLQQSINLVRSRIRTLSGSDFTTPVAFANACVPNRKFLYVPGDGDSVVPFWSSKIPGVPNTLLPDWPHQPLFQGAIDSGWLEMAINSLTQPSSPKPLPPVIQESVTMANVMPVTSAALNAVLSQTDGLRNKCVVVAFPPGIVDATCYVVGTYRKFSTADQVCKKGGVVPGFLAHGRCCFYTYSKATGAWYAVPSVRDPHPLV